MRKIFNGLLFVVLMTSVASAQTTLKVDFNSNQDNGGNSLGASPKNSVANHNQPGWESYHANHEVAAEFVTETYGTISITPDWPNTTDNRVRQSIDRGAGNDGNWNNASNDINLVTDFIGIDTRTSNGGNGNWDGTTGAPTYFTLTLGGLNASDYSWTSFHHDTEDVHGLFQLEISTDGGATYGAPISGYMSDSTSGGTPDSATTGLMLGPQTGPDANTLLSTLNTSFTANGSDDVVLRFAPFAGTGGNAVHNQIWALNGFVLEERPGNVIPEPGTAVLGLLGIGGMMLRRRG